MLEETNGNAESFDGLETWRIADADRGTRELDPDVEHPMKRGRDVRGRYGHCVALPGGDVPSRNEAAIHRIPQPTFHQFRIRDLRQQFRLEPHGGVAWRRSER